MTPTDARAIRLLIVGYGKMGRMVEELAASQGFEIVGRVDQGREELTDAEVQEIRDRTGVLLERFGYTDFFSQSRSAA